MLQVGEPCEVGIQLYTKVFHSGCLSEQAGVESQFDGWGGSAVAKGHCHRFGRLKGERELRAPFCDEVECVLEMVLKGRIAFCVLPR